MICCSRLVSCLLLVLGAAVARPPGQDPEQLLKKGLEAYQNNDFQGALRTWNKGLELAEKQQDDLFIGSFHGNLAIIYSVLGDFPKAAEHFEESLRMAREAGDQQGLKNRLNNLGGLYLLMKQPDKAMEQFNEALPIARDLSDRRLEGSILNNIGEARLMQGKAKKAAESLREALKLATELNFADTEVNALSNLGRAYEAMGNYPQALSHYHKAITMVQKAKDRPRKAATLVRDYNRMGILLRELGEPLAALGAHQSAMEQARTAGLKQQQRASEQLIIRARTEAGDGSAATLRRLRIEGLTKMIVRLRAHGLEPVAREVETQLRKLRAEPAAGDRNSGSP